ncbi:MAG: glycerol-3-phosphate 1-O-acyltransferase PlsY [Peptostreptococcaceae bacterium]|nr:glycerol-3-phosphate 1-O-acyltransferase PlsY [Peptostreptococcaceae bacterium]
MINIPVIITLIVAYLLGNISPSIILGKKYGIDIKSQGSGNAGTTNALRVLGRKAGIITFAGDVMKGVVAVLLGRYVGGETIAMACGLLAFGGHVWPIFFRFKGGKGAATAVGVITAINPVMGIVVALVVVVIVLITRRISVASIICSLLFPFMANLYNPDYLWWSLIMAVIILYKHKENINRLMKGEEPKMNFKK